MAKRGRKKHSVSITLQPNVYYFLLGAVDGKKEKLPELVSAIIKEAISRSGIGELQAFAETLFKKKRKNRKKTEESRKSQLIEEPTEEGVEPAEGTLTTVAIDTTINTTTDPACPEGE